MGFVVVGLDGSEASKSAFHEAVREASWRECSVVALHVTSYPVTNGYGYAYIDLEELRLAGAAFLEREVDALAETYPGGLPVEVKQEAALGHAGVQLLKCAEGDEAGPAELVVVGSRGFGGFRGLLLGSVSTYAAHHLTCRLLIVPAPDDEDAAA